MLPAIYTRILTCSFSQKEYPPKTAPVAWQFPARNRIISGLSDCVVVIEAKEKSGSLITADMALEQGKDIYALPGDVTSQLSRGCNRLIKQGAGILISPEELLKDLGIFHNNGAEKWAEYKIMLESTEDIESLFKMTPYYYKTSAADQEKLKSLSSLEVTLEFAVTEYIKEK